MGDTPLENQDVSTEPTGLVEIQISGHPLDIDAVVWKLDEIGLAVVNLSDGFRKSKPKGAKVFVMIQLPDGGK